MNHANRALDRSIPILFLESQVARIKNRQEPPHIHIERGENAVKYWIEPVALVLSHGFRSHQLMRHREKFLVRHLNWMDGSGRNHP